MPQLADHLTLDAPKRTSDGYLAVRAKAARAGIYDYLAAEVEAPADRFQPGQKVRILRDEADVFEPESVRSFIGRPITDDHPQAPVTRDNWRDHAGGVVMGALRDGEYLAFDLVLMDGRLIDQIDGGKRELSNGYACTLDWSGGVHPKYGAYDAAQHAIRGNHVAVVRDGRAGAACAISDGQRFALCDDNPSALERKTMKTLQLDSIGTVIDVSDSAESAIGKLQGLLRDERDGRAADKAAHDKALAERDAALDAANAKALDDSKLAALVEERSATLDAAKAICGDKLGDTAGKSVADIRRQACALKLGDAAVKDRSDDYVAARFDILAEDKGNPAVHNIAPAGAAVPIADNLSNMRGAARAFRYG